MSPQMNGEMRESAAERTAAARPLDDSLDETRRLPVPEVLNSDKISRTTVVADSAPLAPLFTPEAATEFRAQWDLVQRNFVDDPKEAVRAGDELVAQVITSLAETFTDQRTELERSLDQTAEPTTESLRIALRRYRSFFERLLSI